MLVTLSGIVSLVRPEQPKKAQLEIYATLVPMVMPVRLVQFMNALSPMTTTLLGMT